MIRVANPLVDSISHEYQRRQLIWPARPALLPERELELMRLPFSAGPAKSPFDDCFRRALP